MFGSRDSQSGVGQSVFEILKHAIALSFCQSRRGVKVQTQLNSRIGRVDPLPTGPRCVCELLDEIFGRHDKPFGNARSRWYNEIFHTASVAYPVLR